MKVLFGLALRQTQGFVQSVLELSGLDWQAPDYYSTMSRREKRLTVEIQARPSRVGLHLLVDSTGIKMLGEGEWKTRKYGAEYRRQWRKVHLGRAIWKQWSGYHRRSLVETKMRCFKLLGERVMARTFERQVVELQVRAVA